MLVVPRGGVEGSPAPTRRVDGAEPDQGQATNYVGVVTRTIAIVIDAVLIDVVALAATGAALIVRSVFGLAGKHHGTVVAVIAASAFAIWMISYFAVFWTTTGQTPGNRVMHIRVVRSDGSRVRPRHALIRLGAMAISLPLFWGYLPILTSARRRGVPDVMAGTVVVVADAPDELPPSDAVAAREVMS